MLLGGFGYIRDYPQICEAGYNFAELNIPEIANLTFSELQSLQQKIREAIPVPIASCLLPTTEPLFFTKEFRPESLRTYLENACKKTAQLGIHAVILGNGKARSLLSEEDLQREEVFLDTIRLIAEIAGKNGQELILETLSPQYSNYINTIEQAVQIIKKAEISNIFTMADLRHMVRANDPFENIERYISYIHHLHIDYPLSYPERLYPSTEDDYDYSKYLKVIDNSCYSRTLTIEADIPSDWKTAHKNIIDVLNAYKEKAI